MASSVKKEAVQKQALNRLLMVVSDEIAEDKFKKLIRLYDVEPQDLQGLDQYKTLQHLHKAKVLDLRAFIENLIAVGCEAESEKVAEFLKKEEHPKTGHAECLGEEYVVPVLETRGEKANTVPIEEQDGQSGSSIVLSPSNAALMQTSLTDMFQQSRKGPQRKRMKLYGGASVNSQECDSTYNSENSEEEEEEEHDASPPEAAGKDLEYMTRVLEVAKKSGDPHTKVGAVLVSTDGEIIGEGYNNLPRDDLPWDREADNEKDTKYPYVTHAAPEAIMNAFKSMKSPQEATLYTNLYPSSRDGVTILQAGVKEVVYLDTKRDWRKRYHTGATKRLFDGQIACRQLSMPECK